ncbi:uncharacterized protein LOC131048461 [Cryptomeria japonica]|uniref:uncharacterized protein LOC131048461 n=1 Tax=Cryptomeria japonica TaxID=3369 RepID=UPI0025AD94FF|nr:uncharacterized protein LOC131048461 [Cryptomeria japonica]
MAVKLQNVGISCFYKGFGLSESSLVKCVSIFSECGSAADMQAVLMENDCYNFIMQSSRDMIPSYYYWKALCTMVHTLYTILSSSDMKFIFSNAIISEDKMMWA